MKLLLQNTWQRAAFAVKNPATHSGAMLRKDRARLKEFGENARRRMETWSPTEIIEGTLAAVRAATSRKSRRPKTPLPGPPPSPNISPASQKSSR